MIYPGDEAWNRLSRRNSLVPVTFKNLKGNTVHLKVAVTFGDTDNIKHLKIRELQLQGKAPLDLDQRGKAQFFQCINPKKYKPEETDHPQCFQTHFADWHEYIKCTCGYMYKWKVVDLEEGIYRVFKEENILWDMDEYFDED